jgi:hypothetical protein
MSMAKNITAHPSPSSTGAAAATPTGAASALRSREAARRAGRRDTVGIPVPGLGTVQLSRPQLGYVAGIVLLTATEFLSWPVGLALAVGHLLAADRDSKTLEDFGEALEQA